MVNDQKGRFEKNMYKEGNKVEQMRVAVDLSVWERKGRGRGCGRVM
jgi:hypothetical protein